MSGDVPVARDDEVVSPDEWRAVKAIVQAALALPRDERAAYVDAACERDDRIRREVLSLLDSPDTDPGVDDFLAPPVRGLLDGIDLGGAPRAIGDAATETHETDHAALDALWHALADRYTWERRIGRGGMATVHLARDRRHDRPVAIKVLHPRLATILGRERFLREITLTAALRHPNLLPLYDSGSDAGQLWFAMPYIAGETLRARLAREPGLLATDAVALGREIADAIAHAHARGIVHRDIKPENILLDAGDGTDARPRALVTDFGIARAIDRDTEALLTRTGFAIGTPRYMAPEQARGERDVDARADVYALGVVLHEMLAGEPPRRLAAGLEAASPSARPALARITALPPRIPAPVADVVSRALAPDPEARFVDASALASALTIAALASQGELAARQEREVDHASIDPDAAPSSSASRPPEGVRRERRPSGVVWLVAATLAIGALVGWQGAQLRERASAVLPSGLPMSATPALQAPTRRILVSDAGALGGVLPALTPDGRTMIVAGVGDDRAPLYARPLDAGVLDDGDDGGTAIAEPLLPRTIAGTGGARLPFVSSDGAWLGFVAEGAIRRVPIAGGTATTIATLPRDVDVAGAAWSEEGELVVADSRAGVVYRVAPRGGALERVAAGAPVPGMRDPAFIPGRRAVLVTLDDCCAGRIAAIDLATGTLRVVRAGRTPRIVDGWLVFANADGTIARQRFDAAQLTVEGIVETLARDVDVAPGRTAIAASDAGALLVRTRAPGAGDRPDREALRLVVRDADGRVLRTSDARVPWTPRFSPDGATLIHGGAPPGRDESEIWSLDLATGAVTQRTRAGRDANDAHVSPDARLIAYSEITPRGKRVMVQPMGGGDARMLTDMDGNLFPTGWTADGSAVLATVDRGGNLDIVELPIDGSPARTVRATPKRESAARLTRDGRWLAYESDASGAGEVYVLPWPVGGASPVRISTGGGMHPVWRGDGHALHYWQGDALLAVDVRTTATGTLVVGPPVTRFRARYPDTLFPMYDVSPDGSRIVVASGAPDAERLEIVRTPR